MTKRDWPVSIISQILIEDAIGKFLRTHRGESRALIEALDALPADRTEAEYAAEHTDAR
jgi:hypothetical protein